MTAEYELVVDGWIKAFKTDPAEVSWWIAALIVSNFGSVPLDEIAVQVGVVAPLAKA